MSLVEKLRALPKEKLRQDKEMQELYQELGKVFCD